MRRPVFLLSLLGALLIGLTSCDTQAGQPPAPSITQTIRPAVATLIPPPDSTSPSPVRSTPTDAPARVTATPNAAAAPSASATPNATATATPPGMTIKDDGQSLVLSNTTYYWSMSIPRDWVTTGNNGFEFDANQPGKLAFVHLLSQTWLTKDRKPNAQACVDYWKTLNTRQPVPDRGEGRARQPGRAEQGCTQF